MSEAKITITKDRYFVDAVSRKTVTYTTYQLHIGDKLIFERYKGVLFKSVSQFQKWCLLQKKVNDKKILHITIVEKPIINNYPFDKKHK